MEVALFAGLAALGLALATKPTSQEAKLAQIPTRSPMETFANPLPFVNDAVVVQSQHGHANMVPFYGASRTQAVGVSDSILDNYTGMGSKTHKHKVEATAFFAPEAGNGLPFGKQVETDFEQSRMVTSLALKNAFPIDRVQVGPGVNDGYTNLPSGGYNQADMREYALPKTTDELRVVGNEKVTYTADPVPGAAPIGNRGIQAPVKKNHPDKFYINAGLDHANTSIGVQKGSSLYPTQLLKSQNRATTSTEQIGGATTAASGSATYIRAFTEPFQRIMKLTVEGYEPAQGPGSGVAVAPGPSTMNVMTKRDETVFENARGFEAPLMTMGGQAPSTKGMGAVRTYEPLPHGTNTERNDASILDAFRSNPYTQSLTST